MQDGKYDASRRNILKLAGATAAVATLGSREALASTTPSAKLFATDVGTGNSLMFLHGWACDSHDWSWQLPLFESNYRVVAVDLRGHGRSQVMSSGSYSPAHYVADIETLISTRYAGEKFVLVGHSMGGQIAARLAAARPDLVRAVVSVDGALGFSDEASNVFAKTTHDLQVGDPGVVVPALFQLVYDPVTTQPAFERWHTRRVQGMPAHVVRESFGPLFFGGGQVGVGEQSEKFCKTLTVPVYHLCRDPAQADRMKVWFSNPKSKVDVWSKRGIGSCKTVPMT